MYRLQYNLQHNKPGISNSCWVDPKSEFGKAFSPIEQKHQALCADVIDYVQNHVHLQLSLQMIADHFGISPFHLNTIFQQVYGSTLMRYVTSLRVDVANRILTGNKERINDVANFTGFASATSFSHVFRKKTGMSPRQFRQKSMQDTK
jgi:two-component system response regulator YesN